MFRPNSPVILGFDLEQIATEFIFSPSLSISYPVFQKKSPTRSEWGKISKTRFQNLAILGLFLATFSAPPRAFRARNSDRIRLIPTFYIANESLLCVLSSNQYYKCSFSFDEHQIKNCYPYPHPGKRLVPATACAPRLLIDKALEVGIIGVFFVYSDSYINK